MRPVITVFVVCFKIIFAHEVHESPDSWDYLNQDSWKETYPACGGDRQSPIDFEDACFPHSVTIVNSSLSLHLNNYKFELPRNKVTLKNNGHTAKMSLADTTEPNDWSPNIRGTAVNNDVYQFNELHFHWDQNDTSGSEHSIHGSRQALEMHLVHWNTKYGFMAEAAKHADGLAVLAVLFAPNIDENSKMSPIVDYLRDIIEYDSKVEIEETFTLRSLLPSSYQPFYRYKGSLTTPPCSQVVTWIVVTQVQKIGYAQLNEFTKLDNRENRLVGNTNRKLQPLNGRIVEVSSDRHCKRREAKKSDKKKKMGYNVLQEIKTETTTQSPRSVWDFLPFNLGSLVFFAWVLDI